LDFPADYCPQPEVHKYANDQERASVNPPTKTFNKLRHTHTPYPSTYEDGSLHAKDEDETNQRWDGLGQQGTTQIRNERNDLDFDCSLPPRSINHNSDTNS
jgi:hypothetical protein